MGIDKYENEELIKYGWPEDIWFHVDNLSSAHVYLRLKKGENIDTIPQNVLEDCCQLVKQNSIQGCKEPAVNIVYTPWANLKKTAGMEPGQVDYHSDAQIKYVRNVRKQNNVINRIEKTKEKREVALKEEREQRDREERHEKRVKLEEQKKADKLAQEEKQKQLDIKHYTTIMTKENMTSNKMNMVDDDDFM
ncbi:coiled-coil domain-containing protein 25 [Tieghemostelium lacteum]|uniref:Coiled-coil domain-containing protein 25 n=1 Tax=Tieghemostelium lacteum TaxID=361077 RepID=A0A151Z5B2_TIELA|nr:coiled-coil domain-containing protein 25 [Tieghemostelium lacteum]|eukprot:KYQ89146.1 coiled-coil domain-containing protein 25 [Tieghemostelium lacteum]